MNKYEPLREKHSSKILERKRKSNTHTSQNFRKKIVSKCGHATDGVTVIPIFENTEYNHHNLFSFVKQTSSSSFSPEILL